MRSRDRSSDRSSVTALPHPADPEIGTLDIAGREIDEAGSYGVAVSVEARLRARGR